MGMEMFLIATVTALLTVLVADTVMKRRALLCQQEHIKKPR
jgi:heme exporter protein D